MRITIKINSGNWKRAGESVIVKRIAAVVLGYDNRVMEKTTGYKWDLGDNSWWASEMVDDLIEIDSRYAPNDVMEGLKAVLTWIFQ